MESELANHLITLGQTYGSAKKLGLATVGRLCAADGRFFSRIDDGKTFTVKKYDEVVAWFDRNWPAELVWPEAIRRPVAEAQP
jgi:hypothetical protein